MVTSQGHPMTEPDMSKPDTGEFIRKLHEQPQMLWAEHLQTPAHVHYKAVRMSDPPRQRPVSRDEFRSLLDAFKVPDDAMVIYDTFGSGIKKAANGDQLIMIWQAHTEYYSYQVWHIPSPQARRESLLARWPFLTISFQSRRMEWRYAV